MPDVVFDEFFNLVLPRWLQHHLLDRLDSNHEAVNILNKHVVASYEQLFSVCCRWTTRIDILEICRRLQHALAPSFTRRTCGCSPIAALVASKG